MEYLDKEGLRYYNSKIQTQINAKANDGDLSAVAKSGSYNDLTNKPSIPPEITVDSALSTTSTNPVQNNLVTNALNSKVSSSNVVDNLTSVGANVPLSAKQGKILNESKLEASNIKAGENIVLSKSGNDITISSTGGGGGGSSVAVIDNLNSSSVVSALSANQGRVLDGKITDVADTVDTNSDDIDSLESDVTTLQTNVTNMTADIASLTGSLDDKLDASNILAGTNIAINTDANNNVTISSSASSVSKYSLTELKALTDPTDDLFLKLKADIINHNPMVITYSKNLNSSTSISAEAVVLSATVETVQNFGEVYIISFRKDIISHPGIIHTLGFMPQGEQLSVQEVLMIENEVVTEEPNPTLNLTLDSLEPGDIVGCVSNMKIRYSESDEWSTLEGINTGDIFIKNAPIITTDPVGYIATKMRDNWYMVYTAVFYGSSGFYVYEFNSRGLPINPVYILEKVAVRKDRLIAGTNVSINEDSSGFITISAAGGSVVVDSALSSTSENPVQNKVINSALNNKADASNIPTKVSDLTNDSGFISSYTETDPVFSASAAHGITSSDISSWNNKSDFSGSYTDLTDKPTIPSKTSDLTNDSDFITKTSYASNQNGGVIKTDTSTYGTSMYSGYLTGSTRTYSQYNSAANALFVSKGTLENVITGKGLATSSDIPTKVSDLTNDSGFITSYTETDPVFSASAASGITSSDISSWNNKSTFSGDYDDLTNKPTIPTATSDLTNDSGFITSSYHDSSKQDALVSGTNIKTINGTSILGSGNISLAGGETLKVGTILPFSGSTLPTGYLFCDGSAVSRTTYAGLFDVIGTTFGAGDGSTTFNLPNLKGKVPVGQDSNDTDFDTLGETGGEKTHTLTVNEMPSHTHTPSVVINANKAGYTAGPDWSEGVYTRSWSGDSLTLNNTGGGQPHNNVQPYVVVNYIIKASQTAPVQAQIVDGYSESTTDGYSANYINDALFFKSGDTLTLGNNYINAMGGFITTSRTQLQFTIVSPKSLKNISTISINALRLRGRTLTGTYILTGSSSYADVINNVDGEGSALAQLCTSYTAVKVTDNLIRINLIFDGAIYAINNTPISVEYSNLGITFS